ncbi:hypothetical protein RJ640_016249 [Escallonia rubra]|uniref:GAG-pre-integrase domain-containing protein n=1 Tax=Escallonia rubra TaxID=112253 RepID=A0AA88U4P1_9ASTE|nr:hypothetical protein RJ640_016249 [Escallonia rubra]
MDDVARVVDDNSDDVDVLSITISSSDEGWILDIDSDTIRLWHMHFGHISERGMDLLSKQDFAEQTRFC